MKFLPATALAGLLACPVAAQECIPDAAKGIAILRDKYGETIRSHGVTSTGAIMAITASPSGGWTALLLLPDGRACMIAAGDGFATYEPEPTGEAS